MCLRAEGEVLPGREKRPLTSIPRQATCTGKAGGSATPSDPSQPRPVYAQGYITKDGHHKVGNVWQAGGGRGGAGAGLEL